MRTCSRPECDSRVLARGWCVKHYKRWYKHGDPEAVVGPPVGQTPEQRLRFYGWTEVEGPLDTPCWEFDGPRNQKNYGVFEALRGTFYSHRLSYEVNVGPIPKDQHVLHSCDNPPCVNPGHLRAGTNAENSQDRMDRGRHVALRGEENGHSRLTWTQVREIRSSTGISQRKLAARYGVTKYAVQAVLSGITWKET